MPTTTTPAVRLFRWSLVVFVCVAAYVGFMRWTRTFKLEGNENGISVTWESTSTCKPERLWQVAADAAHDVAADDKGTLDPAGSFAFSQKWKAADDGHDDPARNIEYRVQVVANISEPVKLTFFGESHRQRGASMPAAPFDAAFKGHAMAYVEALQARSKDCGLAGVEALGYP